MNLRNYFDLKVGSIGSTCMGAGVYLINRFGHEDYEALIAGGKQAAYTFLVGGSMTKLCERIARSDVSHKVVKSIVYPSLITIGLTGSLHFLKGTPEPVKSTIPTLIGAPIGFTIWQRRIRRKLEESLEDKK